MLEQAVFRIWVFCPRKRSKISNSVHRLQNKLAQRIRGSPQRKQNSCLTRELVLFHMVCPARTSAGGFSRIYEIASYAYFITTQ